MAFCGKCGAQLTDGAQFCPACGAPVAQPQAATQQPQAAPQQQYQQNNGQSYQQQYQQNNGQQYQQNNGQQYQQNNGQQAGGAQSFQQQFTNTADHTAEFAPDDIAQGKAMSILAYFGILFFLPLVVCPNSKYGRYHANQGLILLITGGVLGVAYAILAAIVRAIFAESLYGFVYGVSGFGVFLLWIFRLICYVPTTVMFILGLINAINGKAKDLPFVGKIRIIK